MLNDIAPTVRKIEKALADGIAPDQVDLHRIAAVAAVSLFHLAQAVDSIDSALDRIDGSLQERR